MSYHNPVLINESIEALNIKPNGIYVDVTFGGGGHAREILKRLDKGHLYAFDQDEDALKNTIEDERFTLINQNFCYLKKFLKLYKIEKVDGILADLGVSSHQIDEAQRGFSFRFDGELDLRMDRTSGVSAKSVINEYEEDKLKKIFYEYGEIPNTPRLVSLISKARSTNSINTTEEFKTAINSILPRGKENRFLAQVFQALRIEVNNELEVLKNMLMQTTDVLASGGKLVIISYHSLEDRLVKHFLRAGKFDGIVDRDIYGNHLTPFTNIKKLVIPTEKEIDTNNRARSAKMRIAERK